MNQQGTAVATTSLSPTRRATALIKKSRDQFLEVLPRGTPVDRFIRAAQTAVLKDTRGKLASCTEGSMFYSLMECARVGLMPDGRQAALIPRWNRNLDPPSNEAHFTPMVEGIIDLMLRAPGVAKVEARAVRFRKDDDPVEVESDEFEYAYGIHSDVRHVPRCPPSAQPYDPRVAYAYAIVWWSNGAPPTFEVVPRAEIDAARTMGQGETPMWQDWYGEGARKVALKRLSKYTDLEPEATAVIEADHEIESDSAADRVDEFSSQVADAGDAEIEGLREGLGRLEASVPAPETVETLQGATHGDDDAATVDTPVGKWNLDAMPSGFGLWSEGAGGWYYPARCRDPELEPATEDLLIPEGEVAPKKLRRADAIAVVVALAAEDKRAREAQLNLEEKNGGAS